MTFPPTTELARDPRVVAGLERQLELRARRLGAGEQPLGWKLGFGSAPAREMLGTVAPLVGFMTDRSVLGRPASCSIGGWANPMLEPEVAARIGTAPTPGGSLEDAAEAIDGLAPAFELADLDPPPANVEEILAGNIFHRAVVVGEFAEPSAAAPEALRGELTVGDGPTEEVADPQAATGPVAGLIRHVADLLAAFDAELASGEIVICGSIVPPIAVRPGDRVSYRLAPAGALEIELAG